MKKILIIDDNELLLDDLKRFLINKKCDVKTVKTGVEGIDMINKEHFDMIITDLFVGCLDGNDVARHIRLINTKSAPIVVGISQRPWLFRKVEFYRIILSPVSISDLTEILNSCLRKREVVPLKKSQTFSSYPFVNQIGLSIHQHKPHNTYPA